MKIRISLVGKGGELAAHQLNLSPGGDEDIIIGRTLIKLIQHSWTLAPGDTIRIGEVEG